MKRIIAAMLFVAMALSFQDVAGAVGKSDRRRRGNYYVNPCEATPTYCITPEGVTIEIYPEITDWTTAQVYDLLRPNAYQLWLIGPNLKVRVQTQSPSSTAISAGTAGGVWANFKAIIYLRPNYIDPITGDIRYQTFSTTPDATVAHEYGHAWTIYHLYLTQQKDWSKWLAFRFPDGIPPQLDTSYGWDKKEIIGDDYRRLFGTPLAVSQMGTFPAGDALLIPGYRDWMIQVWANQL